MSVYMCVHVICALKMQQENKLPALYIPARQLSKDLEIMNKVLQLRVNTWAVLGNGCCMEYHAAAGERSLANLVKTSDDLVLNSSWVPSFQARLVA